METRRNEKVEKMMNEYIEQKIIELQNSKTATEIMQNAKYFINILAENARLTEQLKNAVVLPCIKPFNNGNYGIVYEVLEWDNANGFMTRSYDTLPEAEAHLAELKENNND
jgi:hypothetical protein